MKKNISVVLLFCLWALTSFILTACSEKPKHQALSNDAVILAFGDSLTYGTGTTTELAYPAQLERLSGRRVINSGIPGEISSLGLQRLEALLLRHQPELIIICHGANDILRKLNLDKTQNNLQSMIDLARSKNIQILLIAVPQFRLTLSPHPMYETLANENNLSIESTILSNILLKNSLKSDYVHPNNQGYQLLAETIYNNLLSSGALVK